MKKVVALFLTLCLLLSGCGTDDRKDASENHGRDSAENIGASGDNDSKGADESGDNGRKDMDGNNGNDRVDTDESGRKPADTSVKLYLQERQSVKFAGTEEGYQTINRYYDIMDGRFYLFRTEESLETWAPRICAQVYDSESQTLEQYILTPEIPGYEKYTVCSVGLTAEGDVSLKLSDIGSEAENGDTASLFLVKTDLQGNVLEVKDPFPDEAQYPWNVESNYKRAFHLPDGRTVLCEAGNDGFTADLFWFNGESAQRFGQLEWGMPGAFSCDGDGLLYYTAGGLLYRWDLEKDIRYELFRLSECGISNTIFDLGLIVDNAGDVLVCSLEQDELSVYVFSDRKKISDEVIQVTSLQGSYGMEYIKRKASTFPYDTGRLPVNIEAEENLEYQEDYRNRIVAELTAGKGPDILLLAEDDLRLLSEKGYLCDLSDMIPEDTKAEMIPSVLEMGTVDGRLTGITPHVEFSTLVTGNRTWEKDRWSVEEFLELAQSRDDWETLASFMGSNMSNYMLFYHMFGDGMVNTELLDLEQGSCNLNSDKFVEILELCKKYSEKKVNFESDDVNTLLKEGKIAASYVTIYNLSDFSEVMNRYGDDFHFVGFPTPEGIGNYVFPWGFYYLAVNANSPHKEECKEFITYLLSYENQFSVGSSGSSVRLDVIRDSIASRSLFEGGVDYVIKTNPDSLDGSMLLTLKPDGTPWLDEFMDFVKNTRPEPFMPKLLTSIMGSELKAYFEEGRSARDTADNLQNRVQLYLDEMK